MLSLTRVPSSSVTLTIPPSAETRVVTVKFIRGSGRQITLGFDAPKDIKIIRTELLGKAVAK